ncbi:MAG: ABC transporter substrate-binding protein [Bacteroidales bacterium]|nr:ABC transporter substrate-binding protein [Bacteroidales bacterium]MDD4822035.1 ABC transporter substrate-binding protein [Bacteroidales bacterium]
MKKYSIIVLSVAVIAALCLLLYKTCNRAEGNKPAGLTKVRVQLQWFDGTQFIGLYIAQNKKFFEEEGLDVELLSGSYSMDPFQIVSDGRADIGMTTGDRLLMQFAEKGGLKVLGTVFNQSTACFMAMKGKIETVNDFKGKKIGVYSNCDTDNILRALLQLHNIDTSDVNFVQAEDIAAFRTGEIDLFPSYVFNEPIRMELEGIQTKLFFPKDYGVTFYSDIYFSTDKYYKDNRDVIKRFLRASAKGWDYAKNNQKESIKTMFSMFKNMTFDENHVKEEKSLEVISTYLGDGSEHKINYMQREKWLEMEDLLVKIGKIKQSGHVDQLCDFKIIDEQ